MKNSPPEWEYALQDAKRRARDAEHLSQAYGEMLDRQILQMRSSSG